MTAIDSRYTTTDAARTYSSSATLTLAAGAYLMSTVDDGLDLLGSSATYDVTISGIISAKTSDLWCGIFANVGVTATITINEGGVVRGDAAIYFSGIGDVVNNGGLYATSNCGVFYNTAGDTSLTNTGTISSLTGQGVFFHAAGTHTVINSGLIQATAEGGVAVGGDAPISVELLTNTGMIVGDVKLGAGEDVVHNETGIIKGLVDLGDYADQFFGGLKSVTVNGGQGADEIAGGDKADVIDGGFDNDLIHSSLGGDNLTGGEGEDSFIFEVLPGKKADVATITDFSSSDDVFNIDNAVFRGLKLGDLAKKDFTLITSAASKVGVDASDRILYDKAHGDIYFDRDGSKERYDRVLFAHVEDGLAINYKDFHII